MMLASAGWKVEDWTSSRRQTYLHVFPPKYRKSQEKYGDINGVPNAIKSSLIHIPHILKIPREKISTREFFKCGSIYTPFVPGSRRA